ncbi:MAG: serine/threonine protein kinase [Myxococcales bacterium]|nr:serine/threonine protein kinase [Myxococcales bacterium]
MFSICATRRARSRVWPRSPAYWQNHKNTVLRPEKSETARCQGEATGPGFGGGSYAAYDPELERKVALKLVIPAARGSRHGQGSTRLLREAQALAKLNHPNVVTVHDVGAIENYVWLAMEYIEGETLSSWGQRARPSWREVVDVMTRAGLGLEAAHAAGLLHRDFKPDNVMIGRDGRVRVMDFGLARARAYAGDKDGEDDEEEVDETESMSRSELGSLSLEITQAGSLLGTPAYMAPEQYCGLEVTAAADQFAFCVTMWELLYGARPFSGDSIVKLAAAAASGAPRAPAGARVPGWLRRICERGLSPEPGDRFPSIAALLGAVDSAQRRRRVGRRVAVVLGAGSLVAGGFGLHELRERQQRAACEAAGATIEEVWGDARRDALREALLRSGASVAETTAQKVTPWLDRYAATWRAARVEACYAGERDEQLSLEEYGRARWCLEARRMEFSTLLEELSRGDTLATTNAVTAASSLQRAQPCLDRRLLQLREAPPPAAREDVRAALSELSRASGLLVAGEYAAGLERAEAALARAEAISWAPLELDARLLVGRSYAHLGRYADAVDVARAVYLDAAKLSATELAFRAAVHVMETTGVHLERTEESLLWGQLAEVELARLGGDEDALRSARLLRGRGLIRYRAGEYDESRALLERARALRTQALGEHHPDVMSDTEDLANTLVAMGSYEEARALLERSVAVYEETYGAEHLQVAEALNNLGTVDIETGARAQARRSLTRALELRERALGSEHPSVADSLVNLAVVERGDRHNEAARALYERAITIYEATLGPEHPKLAVALNNLALTLGDAGAHDEAKALHERVLAIRERALGEGHPSIASAQYNLALVVLKTDGPEAGRRALERALALWEKALGAEHPHLAHPLTNLSELARDEGRVDEAVALAERAVTLRERAGVDRQLIARSVFARAEALWDARQRERALADARAAATIYRDAARQEQLDKVEAWLAERERTPRRAHAGDSSSTTQTPKRSRRK